MPLLAIAFLLGITALHQQASLPPLAWAFSLLALAPLLWHRWGRVLWMLVAGFIWALWHVHGIYGPALDPALEGIDLHITGVVRGIPQQRERATVFAFEITDSRSELNSPLPRQVRLSWYGAAPAIHSGQHWALTVRLKRPSGMRNPGGFDHERWLFQQGYAATGSVRNPGEAQRLPLDPPARTMIDRLRASLIDTLQTALPDAHYRGIILALSVGYRGEITRAQWQTLTSTGTNHLLAISGLHVSLLAGIGYLLTATVWRFALTPLCLWLPAQRAGLLGALAFGFAYALLAGFAIPTQRALIMLSVALIALWFGRGRQPWNVLSLALMAVLLWDPRAVLAGGFWLSFAVVAIILYGLGGRTQQAGKIRTAWQVHWVSAVGLIPLTILWFQSASLISPLANLVAVPWVSFLVVPVVLMGVLVVHIHEALGIGLLTLADALICGLWWFMEWLESWPGAHYYLDAPLGALLLGLLGVLWLLAPKGMPARWLGLVMLLPVVFVQRDLPQHGEFRLIMLDVGQGLAMVVKTRQHTLVYDTGPMFSASFDTGAAVVVPYLRYAGRAHIHRLLISHGDSDHSGGTQSVLDQIARVDSLWSRDLQQFVHPDHQLCLQGQHWQWDGVAFTVLHPPPGWGNDNMSSCVVLIQGPGGSLLLTGDLESLGETVMWRHYREQLAVDVLQVAHHGSRHATREALLNWVQPQWALISAGYRSRFGHPHPETLARLEAVGAQTLDTATQGAIEVRFVPERWVQVLPGYRIRTQRHYHRE